MTAGSPHGPWRLSNSPALAIAFPNVAFVTLGLPPLVLRKPNNPPQPPYTDPYVRWCGRGDAVRRPPILIAPAISWNNCAIALMGSVIAGRRSDTFSMRKSPRSRNGLYPVRFKAANLQISSPTARTLSRVSSLP